MIWYLSVDEHLQSFYSLVALSAPVAGSSAQRNLGNHNHPPGGTQC